MPPPPPRKIPLDRGEEPKVPKMIPKRPQYDPQHSYDGGQQQTPPKLRRPRFDPQHSHDNTTSPPQWQNQDRQPTIPVPQFTSFNIESALPPAHIDSEPSFSQTSHNPQPNGPSQKSDTYQYHARGQSSISPIGPIEQNAWMTDPESWDSRAAYTPSSEQQHTNLSQRNGPSASATDISPHVAGKSTPRPHQTLETTFRENENQVNMNAEAQSGGDDSFYWHSGRSSSDVDEANSQASSLVATSGGATMDERSSTTNSTVVPREHRDLPIRSTSLSPSMSAPYGASALGIGGPSDWEYFGDYEAEDIDDEELYSKPKTKDDGDAPEVSAELPAHVPLLGAMRELPSEPTLSNVPPLARTSPVRPAESDFMDETFKHSTETSSGGGHSSDTETTMKQCPTTPRPTSRGPMTPSNTSPDQRPDLDEIIRAWSEAPNVGKLEDKSPPIPLLKDHNGQPESFAEASLASTPREELLGADGSLNKNSASPPLLPSTNPLKFSVEQSGTADETLTAPSDASLASRSNTESEPDPQTRKEQQSTADDLSERIKTGGVTDQRPSSSQSIHDIRPQETGYSRSNLSSPSLLSTVTSVVPVTASTQPIDSQDDSDLTDPSAKMDGSASDQHSPATSSIGSQRTPLETSSATSDRIMPEKSLEPGSHSELLHTGRDQPIPVYQGSSQELEPVDKILGSHSADHDQRGHISVSQTHPEGPQLELSPEPHSQLAVDTLEDLPPKTSTEYESAIDSKTSTLGSQDVSGSLQCTDTTEDLSIGPGGTEKLGQPATSKASLVSLSHSPQSLPVTEKVSDPYADLDPWGKASLNRFAAMLREESRAEFNKDKLNIFNVFTSRESRLRVVLYGTEDDLINPQKIPEHDKTVTKAQEAVSIHERDEDSHENSKLKKNESAKPAVMRTNTMSLQRSLKALPALPTNRDSVIGLPGNALAPLIVQENLNLQTDHSSTEDELITDEAQYSPGGRPVISQVLAENTRGLTGTLHETAAPEAVAGANDHSSPSSSAPLALIKEEITVTKKPAYTPPKYHEPRSEVKNYLANRKSVIRPYATLTQGSLDHGSTFGKEGGLNETNIEGSVVPAPISQYNAVSNPKDGNIVVATKASESASQSDLRCFVKADFDPIVTILPASEAVIPRSNRLNDLQNLMETIPDDFSFIHQSVVAWDTRARKQREEKDRQRHARQIESEQRIDSLFDDHEIGYGDISELESEFKRSEAARKADEDRSEYQMFVSDVFTLVWTRLHYELDQLIPDYEKYCNLMNDTLAGRDMFEASSQGLALAPTMDLFLTLHQKLEIRYQKAFEAVLERDRRLKKTEISPWYTLSNITKVKQLEKQFEDAEKKAIIEYCQQRDSRASRLMDVLDHNTLRGVGTNQDYMEAIWKAVNRIASGRAFASVSGSKEPTAGMEEIEKAKTVTNLLAISSEQIVQTFHVADMLLNSAVYEVSVARAKVSDKSDVASLAKLKEARAKEDQKLMRELEHRLALIREDTRRTNDAIVKLMLFLGVTNGRADSTRLAQPGPPDPGHEARIQKALEEAKRRNASKDSGG